MNFFDVIVLIILMLSIYTGYRRGLKSLLGSIMSFILGGVVAYLFYKPITIIIEKNFKLLSFISSAIRAHISSSLAILPATMLKYKIVEFLKSLKIPTEISEKLKDIVSKMNIPSNQTIGSFLPDFLGKIIVGAFVYSVIFILAYLLFKLLLRLILKGVEKTPTFRKLGAFGNFILMSLITVYFLNLYDILGLSIFISQNNVANIISSSLTFRLSKKLYPMVSYFIKIFLGWF